MKFVVMNASEPSEREMLLTDEKALLLELEANERERLEILEDLAEVRQKLQDSRILYIVKNKGRES